MLEQQQGMLRMVGWKPHYRQLARRSGMGADWGARMLVALVGKHRGSDSNSRMAVLCCSP